jgi:hypothetical protein
MRRGFIGSRILIETLRKICRPPGNVRWVNLISRIKLKRRGDPPEPDKLRS